VSERHLPSVSAVSDHVRVLFLEDEAADMDLVERALTRGGLDVQIERVANEQEFRRALRDGPWDIILTDFRLPSFDGLAALRVLREEASAPPAFWSPVRSARRPRPR
jgi:DNA-binding response OmpR family regulator